VPEHLSPTSYFENGPHSGTARLQTALQFQKNGLKAAAGHWATISPAPEKEFLEMKTGRRISGDGNGLFPLLHPINST
jgi:hypothetical protein